MEQLARIRNSSRLLAGAKEFYRLHWCEFINHWVDTYDPRNAGSTKPTTLPLVMFPRQEEYVLFLFGCITETQHGLTEKSRDMGATWLAAAATVAMWLFWDGVSVGWGSRVQDLVDKIGDLDTIFEKIRFIIRHLPRDFLPVGFNPKAHMGYMLIFNPETEATITGESGDQMGRGGRTLVYFKDESAHYQHPEAVEASLLSTTRVQIDISSVSGLGTVFERKRSAGVDWDPTAEIPRGMTRVFVLDWSDHPEKPQAWYDEQRADYERRALLHVFAREVERNYAAAVEDVVIPAHWVLAAIDADLKLGILIEDDDPWMAALDVADEGGDANALSKRQGIVLRYVEDWGVRDTGVTTRKTVDLCRVHVEGEGPGAIDVQYDAIGVGAGVKSEANRLADDDLLPPGIRFIPWVASAAVRKPEGHVVKKANGADDPKSPKNKNFFQNFKAQAAWELRRRFELTWRAVSREPDFTWEPQDLISLSSRDIPRAMMVRLRKELSQPTATSSSSTMKWTINKKPKGSKSPNLFDSVCMCYWPAEAPRMVISAELLEWAARTQ